MRTTIDPIPTTLYNTANTSGEISVNNLRMHPIGVNGFK